MGSDSPVGSQERAERLRALLALEIDRIVHDLRNRKAFMVGIWARLRSREPFMETLFTRWRTLGVDDLSHLDTEQIIPVEHFHNTVDELRMYLRFTEDMPNALSDQYDRRLKTLEEAGVAAVRALGGVPAHPVRPPALTLEDVPPPPAPDLSDPEG